MMGRSDGRLFAWMWGGEVPNMAPTRQKRPFVPSALDRRRASEFRRRAEEIGQPALAKIVGVGVRTLQRYIKLQRSMRAQDVDAFEARFGPIDFPSQPPPLEFHPTPDGAADDATLERVLARHEMELNYAVVRRVRDMRASGLTLSEDQWDKLVSAIVLAGRHPGP